MRVAVGERTALAFCLGTRAYDIDEFQYAPQTGRWSFRLIALPDTVSERTVDLVVTAPCRDLAATRSVSMARRFRSIATMSIRSRQARTCSFAACNRRCDRDRSALRHGRGAVARRRRGNPLPRRPTCSRRRSVDHGGPAQAAVLRSIQPGGSLGPGTAPRRSPHRAEHPFRCGRSGDQRRPMCRHSRRRFRGEACVRIFAVLGREHEQAANSRPVGVLRVTFAGGEQRLVQVDADTPLDLTNGFRCANSTRI